MKRDADPTFVYPHLNELRQRLHLFKIHINKEFSHVKIKKQDYLSMIEQLTDFSPREIQQLINKERENFIWEMFKHTDYYKKHSEISKNVYILKFL